ncbi:MAG: oxidoreductase [Alphaproteobacteria bacterium]
MTRDSRYDILFEPVRIGPVTARNRFYQVPHCTGIGRNGPRMLAALRGMKAEGGWGVVCTEYCSIHPSSDDLPHISATLWDDGDIKANALMTEAVHAHGSLAGTELWFGGASSANLGTREIAMDMDSLPNSEGHPFQTRAMDKSDIRELRRWHRNAALRAKKAGFDIVYVYATHHYLLSRFLSPVANTRIDEYGGALENRVRLVRELIEDTKDAIGDTCAVAVRFSSDEPAGIDGNPVNHERRDMLEMLGELPDLWDVNISDYSYEMGTSRFVKEGSLEPYMAFAKSVTSKPVVTVGRFTSPDTMASQVKRGIVDFIGAARPSIADPFLPKKIEEGRLDDIRECIGCNVCYAGDAKGFAIRCTQNPTMGDEWRRGWHPEKIAPKGPSSQVLIVGAGPAGLEAARALGQRGYNVMLAEATRELGGRVTREASLPGLSEWMRVRDYRVNQLDKMPNVEVFRESELSAADVLAVGADHVAIATGARWRSDRFNGLAYEAVIDAGSTAAILTPDDIMAGRLPKGPTLIFDDDSYYLGGVLAERLRAEGLPVTLATPAAIISAWCGNTGERPRIERRLRNLNVDLLTGQVLARFNGHEALLKSVYTGAERTVAAEAVVMVCQRRPNDGLYHDIKRRVEEGADNAPRSLRRIGDCEAPAIIAAAVHAGHRFARELDASLDADNPLRHERVPA